MESFAKVNLTLEIVGRRPDGYHELRTIFQTIGLADTLFFDWDVQSANLLCDDPSVPTGENNLIWKALRAVEKFSGCSIPVEIRLEKRIPMEAGLGGGSSNAAAVLRVLAERLRVPESSLPSLASSLGSDVPFFLRGGTMLGKGRGEILEELPSLPSFPIVVIKPPFSISTSSAYGKIRNYSNGKFTEQFISFLRRGEFLQTFSCVKNDFEEALFPDYPKLKELRERLEAFGATAVLLSGSGSAMFAVGRDLEHAEEIAASVRDCGKVWVTQLGHELVS